MLDFLCDSDRRTQIPSSNGDQTSSPFIAMGQMPQANTNFGNSHPNSVSSEQKTLNQLYVSVNTHTYEDDGPGRKRGSLARLGSWFMRKWSDWWIDELLSTLLGFISLAAIVIVLRM